MNYSYIVDYLVFDDDAGAVQIIVGEHETIIILLLTQQSPRAEIKDSLSLAVAISIITVMLIAH